jgi:peptidyl-prolyl cis-trans isomerase C
MTSRVMHAGSHVPLRRRRQVLAVMARCLREPLLHFLVLGFALSWAGHLYQQRASIYHITETPARIAYLRQQYALQFGTAPDATMLQILIRRDIHDEMLLRQGLALKLDQGDEILRRRIVQKMQFLLNDTHAPPEPTEAQLRAYYQAHEAAYRRPAQVTFTHIFFSDDPSSPSLPAQRARDLLPVLNHSGINRAPQRGDPFPDRYDFADYDIGQVTRLFGKTELSRQVFSAPVGRWSGPFRSGYGWHLVHIDARQDPMTADFEAVRERVRTDWLQSEQQKANEAALARLASGFTVTLPDARPSR